MYVFEPIPGWYRKVNLEFHFLHILCHFRLDSSPHSSETFVLALDPAWRQNTQFLGLEEVESIVRSKAIRWTSVLVAPFGALDGRQREAVIGAAGGDIYFNSWLL